jgi:hypothetical protein
MEKRDSFYRTITLGFLIYNGHIKTLEEALANYWQLKAIDLLKTRQDFPLNQKEIVIDEIINGSNLRNIVNSTHLSGFTVVKDSSRLIVEVIKLLHNAQKKVYFTPRYHDSYTANKTFERFSEGVILHLLDDNPEQISAENRINTRLRTRPNKEIFTLINKIRSPHFELKREKCRRLVSWLLMVFK